MALGANRTIRRVMDYVRTSHLTKFLIVGGFSFAIDLGLLIVLHEVFGMDLWLATPIAFIASLVFNFVVQRRFTFQATIRSHVSMLRYGLLVIFNIFATDVIVNAFDNWSLTYAGGKVVATVSTMIWNFFLYKHWIFRNEDLSRRNSSEDRTA